MNFNVTTRVDGIQQVRNRFKMIERAPQKVLKQIADDQVRETQNRIRTTKLNPQGQTWAPWSMATLRQRQRDGSAARGLLFKTGQLWQSIQYRISEKTLTIFSNIGYARYLQEGTMRMPARPFLGWSQQALNSIKQKMKDAIK